ncbi:HNH endonuclease signature motif containing protein [Kribbella monticola]|uniref:HNH endonuclease signature motif containing protein n=1 Tax=Kribbella monticola TaxID=2185285 RepID=UPI0013006D91|nr:HNH endonuclease signature motif containing protein [Kribbella monticola]
MEFPEPRPAYMMSDSEMLAALDAVHDEVTRLNAYRLELLARYDDTGHAKVLGAHDTIELISSRHRLNSKDVRADLKLAKALPKYKIVDAAVPKLYDAPDPATADEEARYNLHLGQAKAIVNALESIPTTAMVPVEQLNAAEAQLVKAARHLNPADLRKLGNQARDILDTDGPEPAEEDAYRREALWHRKADNGVRFGGYLANEDAELFQTLIHAGSKPHKTLDGQPDPRGRDKRQADALVNLLNTAATTSTGGTAPHISVTIDYDSLKSDLAAAYAAHETATPDTETGSPAAAPASSSGGMTSTATAVPLSLKGRGPGFGQVVFGDNLSASAVRRLACDANIIPIVLGSDSQPLDVGMEKRFVTSAMRHALKLRDKGCVICGAPPIQCDAHHLVHWADGGPTALHNLALFCKIHHREIHSGRWTVTIVDGIVNVTRPTWADPPIRPPLRLSRLASGNPVDAAASIWSEPHPTSPADGQPPRMPGAPGTPGPLRTPWAPPRPEAPRTPGTPGASGAPRIPWASATPELPPTPASPPTPAAPSEPGAPGEPGAPRAPWPTTAVLEPELNHSPDAAHPPPTRIWPHTTDVPWITPEEAARLNPWGDGAGDVA